MSEIEPGAYKFLVPAFLKKRDHEYAAFVSVKGTGTDLESGMSLVEMLVSLVVLSLVLTITVQSGVQLLTQWQVRDAEREIIRSIEAYRREALVNRRAVRVSLNDINLPDAAKDWQIELSGPLLFSKSGLCNTSYLAITAPGRPVSEYIVTPPSCVPMQPER
jgi:prepilin-type N-terminal cleavage/methylation domain-containing protein